MKRNISKKNIYLAAVAAFLTVGLSVGTAMAKMRMRREIIMVSDGITEADAKACGIGYYPLADLQKAIDDTIKKYDNPTVSAISHGGELYVY